ncbi:MAG: divergent polysaccharide deacetylase family protein [Pseudomonadota bacterium]
MSWELAVQTRAAFRGWTETIARRSARLRRLLARSAFRRLAALADDRLRTLPIVERLYSSLHAPHGRSGWTIAAGSALAWGHTRRLAERAARVCFSPRSAAAARLLVAGIAINIGLGAATIAALETYERLQPREPVLSDAPSRAVRAQRMILAAPPTVATVWRGERHAAARRNAAPGWASALAAPSRPLAPSEALSTPPRLISVAPAPLWSPYMALRSVDEPEEGPTLSAAAPVAPVAPVRSIAETFGGADIETADIGRTAETGSAPEPEPLAIARLPQIALVVTAVGLNAEASEAALTRLPQEVAIAVAPIADNSERWATAAQRLGRTLLVEAPLEPAQYPRVDPGPLTMLVGDAAADNLRRLDEALAAAPGAEGVSTYLGGGFLIDAGSAALLATAAERRDLMVFQNDGPADSRLPAAARSAGARFLASSVALDNGGRTSDIGLGLRLLERTAKRDGRAVGVIAAAPAAIEALRRWIGTIDARGLQLTALTEIDAEATDVAAAP